MAGRSGQRGWGSIRPLPSGRYQAFYTDPEGRTYLSPAGNSRPLRHVAPVTFESKIDAEAWLADERRSISTGQWTPPKERAAVRRAKTLAFGEYAEAWLAGRKVRGRPIADRTRDGYRDLLDRFILPTFGDVPLKSITPEMVDHWYELTAIGRPTYQARAYSLLRTILGSAVDRSLIATANPAKVRGGGSTKRAKKIQPATLAELGVIAAAMPERRRLMVVLAAWTALRFGELAELRRSDVDLKAGVIHVRRGVVRVRQVDADGLVTMVRKVKAPKTEAGERDVPIPPHLFDDLREHLTIHAEPGRDGLLFPARSGEQLSPSVFYGREALLNPDGTIKQKGHGYYEARRAAGRPDLNFHALRHTGLTNAAVAGATLAELMALAGHSTPGAAMRYQHAAQDRMQELAKRMSAMAASGADGASQS